MGPRSLLPSPACFHRLFSEDGRGSEQKSLRGVLPYSASPLRSLPCPSAPPCALRTLVHPALTPTPRPLHPKSRPTSLEPDIQEPEPERTHLLPLGRRGNICPPGPRDPLCHQGVTRGMSLGCRFLSLLGVATEPTAAGP